MYHPRKYVILIPKKASKVAYWKHDVLLFKTRVHVTYQGQKLFDCQGQVT